MLLLPVVGPLMRFWRHEQPGVVLGASQQRLLPSLASHGIEFVGRKAGGGAVLAGPWMLSLSVLLPAGHRFVGGGMSPAYEWIGTRFAEVLRALGVDAHPAPKKREAGELAWACFGGFSPWEVLIEDRKIVGLAQRRSRTGVLVAAGILLHAPDWRLLCSVMHRPEEECSQLAASTIDLHEALEVVPDASVVANELQQRLHSDLFRKN